MLLRPAKCIIRTIIETNKVINFSSKVICGSRCAAELRFLNTSCVNRGKIKSPLPETTVRKDGVIVESPVQNCSDDDITNTAIKLIKSISVFDKMITTVPIATVKDRISTILNLGADLDSIYKLLSTNFQLVSSEKLDPLVKCLQDNGFKNIMILKVLSNFKNVHLLEVEAVQNCFECLRSIGLKQRDILSAFLNNPSIVNLSNSAISHRMKELKELFKIDDVHILIAKNPNILIDDMDDIQESFMYVFQIMGISQRQMMYSSIFQHSRHHIRCRHLFLERAGLFTKVKKSNSRIPSNNPTLDTILDSPDSYFVKRFGNMSLIEYNTFCKLLQKEILEHEQAQDQEI